MDGQTHWENIYGNKAPDTVRGYRPHLEKSLELIEHAAHRHSASIIDVRDGEFTLVDDLIARGHRNITILDISRTAIDVTNKRLGAASKNIHWLIGDITSTELERVLPMCGMTAPCSFPYNNRGPWAYVRQVAKAMKAAGHVIVSTFGPEGPTKCTGLGVVRYDAESLHEEFGVRFQLLESSTELHQTPFGTMQQFLYCFCRIE